MASGLTGKLIPDSDNRCCTTKEESMRNRIKAIIGAAVLAMSLLAAPAYAAPGSNEPLDPTSKIKLAEPIARGKSSDGVGSLAKGKPPVKPNKKAKATKKGGVTTFATACPSGCYDYAGAYQYVTAGTVTGAEIRIEVENPTKRPWDRHSLGELSVQDESAGNFVESMWTVDDNVCGAGNSPCFTMYHWVGGVGQGYGVGFTPVGSPPISHGSNVSALIGSSFKTSWDYFDNATCGCTTGWWLSYATTGSWAYAGLFAETRWTSQGTSFTDADVDLVQAFGEVGSTQLPTQTHIGTGSILNKSSMTGFDLHGASAPSNNLTLTTATSPDRYQSTLVSATAFDYGGPGGTETIPGVVTADDTYGVGTGTNPSGLGSFATFDTSVSSVPSGKVTQIDGSASNACRGNVGTSQGYVGISYVALSLFKKVTVYSTGNCTGTGLQLNHGRAGLPAPYNNAANFSYKVDTVYATCATGFPTTAPTC